MPDWVITSLIAGFYLMAVLAIGIKMRPKNVDTSVEVYLAGGRSLGILLLFFIIGAEFYSSATFLGAPGWVYAKGAPGLYLLVTFALALIPWWWIGTRTARLGRQYGFLTQAQLLGARFNSRLVTMLAAIIGLSALIPYLLIQIVGAGYLFSAATGGNVPFWIGALLAFGVVLLYIFISGLKGIGYTSVFQGIIMLIVAWSIGFAIPEHFFGGIGPMFEELSRRAPDYLVLPGHNQAMSWGAYSSTVAVVILGMSMWPHLFNRAYGADSEASIKKTIMIFPLFGLLLVPILIVGFCGILVVDNIENPDHILITLVKLADFSPWFVGLLLSGALAASMSTGANLLHTVATIFIEDVYIKSFRKKLDSTGQVKFTRLVAVVVCLFCYLLALNPPQSIMSLVVLSYGTLVQLLPIVLAALFWQRATGAGAICGLVAGLGVVFYFNYSGAVAPLDIHSGILGLLVNAPLLVVVSLLTEDKHKGLADQFIRTAEKGEALM